MKNPLASPHNQHHVFYESNSGGRKRYVFFWTCPSLQDMWFIDIFQQIKLSQLLYSVLFFYSSVSAIENSNLIEFCIRSNDAILPLWTDHKFLRHFTLNYLGTLMQTIFRVRITSTVPLLSKKAWPCLSTAWWAELRDTKISAVILKLIGIDKVICMLCLIVRHSLTGKILVKIIELCLQHCFNKVCPGILLQLYFIKSKSWFLSLSRWNAGSYQY